MFLIQCLLQVCNKVFASFALCKHSNLKQTITYSSSREQYMEHEIWQNKLIKNSKITVFSRIMNYLMTIPSQSIFGWNLQETHCMWRFFTWSQKRVTVEKWYDAVEHSKRGIFYYIMLSIAIYHLVFRTPHGSVYNLQCRLQYS